MAEGALETEKGLLNETKKKPKKAACLSKRWTIAYMGMWFGVLGYGLNTNMSVAIVCMASTTHNTSSSDVTSPLSEGNATDLSFLKNGTYDIGHAEKHNETQLKDNIDDHDSITYIDDDNQITEKGNERNTVNVDILQCAEIGSESYKQNAEFSWDKRTQSFILSGFFYGYIFVQIVGGWAAGRFGGKLMIGAFMGLGSLVTLLIPSLARTSPYALVAARVVIGMSAGLALPGWFKLTAVWARENERTRFISIIPTVPWLDMVTYTPIYGPLVAHICDTWTFYLILTCLPQYIKEVLKFDIQSQSSEEWRIVLLTAAGVSVFGTIVYDLLASSELAPWSDRMEFEIEISLDKDQKSEL
ncbi:S17A5-like protein [Mya arenaria]|uniref:S17A5-like protein n=1 Tax=Mya arenaria TaxID=6604 RepID=A0ABY7E449_MYAAR|nr:S17A5-like protein [Mya arenaria]